MDPRGKGATQSKQKLIHILCPLLCASQLSCRLLLAKRSTVATAAATSDSRARVLVRDDDYSDKRLQFH